MEDSALRAGSVSPLHRARARPGAVWGIGSRLYLMSFMLKLIMLNIRNSAT
jgi:hypothetical protein